MKVDLSELDVKVSIDLDSDEWEAAEAEVLRACLPSLIRKLMELQSED